MYQERKCAICQSGGTNMMNCPMNPDAKHKSYKKHPNCKLHHTRRHHNHDYDHNDNHQTFAVLDPKTCIMYQHEDGKTVDYCYNRSRLDACGGLKNFDVPSGKCKNDNNIKKN